MKRLTLKRLLPIASQIASQMAGQTANHAVRHWRWAFIICLLGSPAPLLSQSKSSFGTTDASRCYSESNAPVTDQGVAYCTAAIKHGGLLVRDLAATYTNRGIIYAANKRYREAMSDHNKALRLAPNMTKVLVNRGNVHHRNKDYALAIADYNKALELGGVAKDIIYYNRALTRIGQQRWHEAESDLRAALEVNPKATRARTRLEEITRAAPDQEPPPAR